MKIEIEALTFSLTLTQRRYVEKLMTFALGANSKHIETVEVWLSEYRVAEDDCAKRCLVWVQLDGNTLVVSESTDADLRVAIHRAADQAGWKVSRNIVRRARARGLSRLGQVLPGSVGNRSSYPDSQDAA